ncbi:MAG: hypothetical protein D6741_03275, partial [Planctomycetota bacterium]
MSDSFNPYHEWLNRPPNFEPEDHYSLLGIPQFTDDLETIRHTADVLLAAVRRIRPGAHLKEWAQLLDDLEAAKKCLMDPDAKAEYDASLRSRGSMPSVADKPTKRSEPSQAQFDYKPKAALGPAEPATPSAAATLAAEPEEPAVSPVAPQPTTSAVQPAISTRTSMQKTKTTTADLIYRAGAFGLLVVAIVLAGVVVQRVRAHLQAHTGTELVDASQPPIAEESPFSPAVPAQSGATVPPSAPTSQSAPRMAGSSAENHAPNATAGEGGAATPPTVGSGAESSGGTSPTMAGPSG